MRSKTMGCVLAQHVALVRPDRSQLLGLHRTAVLRHDEYGAETLLNLLLRNYLDANLYDQARAPATSAHCPFILP